MLIINGLGTVAQTRTFAHSDLLQESVMFLCRNQNFEQVSM
jgi:hypothetical protein